MKILLVNKFFFFKGGSETAFFDTAQILKQKGHEVAFFSMHHSNNFESPYSKYFVDYIDYKEPHSLHEKIKGAVKLVYSLEAKNKIKKIIMDENPDIVHFHNIHSQISPSIISVLKKEKIPCVMTLHDYKLVCPVYTMLSKGKICERCSQEKFYHCFLNKCTKNSYSKSLLNTLEMYIHHNIMHVYDLIDEFISPSKFLINKIKEMGFSKNISYLPNPVFSQEFIYSYKWVSQTLVYNGRLSYEKGLHALLKAVKGLDVECRIYGDGPIKNELKRIKQKENLTNVFFYGHQSKERLMNQIKKAMFIVVPSEWYENSPYAVVEAFASGKPVIGSRIGGIPELIKENQTGLTFQPGNHYDLRKKILFFLNNPQKIIEMGKKARKFSEEKLNPIKYYDRLFDIYERILNK